MKFSNFSEGLTYENVTVKLDPSSTGMAPVTLDSDKNCVFKITDKNNQRIYVTQTASNGEKRTQILGLSHLTLEDAEGGNEGGGNGGGNS